MNKQLQKHITYKHKILHELIDENTYQATPINQTSPKQDKSDELRAPWNFGELILFKIK